MKKISLVLSFLFAFTYAEAQQFGGFPPSTKWKQINTDTVRVIYTEGAKEDAERIATLIHAQAADTSFSLGKHIRKINVVLQSKTTLANGYVALAPFRSEYYLVPPSNVFDFGNLPWQDNLAIHEYRHVQQYNNFKNGWSKGFFYLFGERGLALANALSVPDWFFEGDAVHAETAFTKQGRGRLPYFLSAYNSLWLENKQYSWMKLRNGSLKDFVPNYYALGYLLVNYGYLKYGNDFWMHVTQDASAFRGLFYPFQKAVKKYAGVDYKTFRKEAFNFYQQKLGVEKKVTTEKNKTVTNYYFPQLISNDSLLYLKTAYNKLPAFYIQDKSGAHKIALKDIGADEWFSYRNGKIAYTAYSTNPRWSLIDFSDIVLLDINTKKEKRITSKAKYFTPDISPSGNKIITVCITNSLQTELQVLNTGDGSIEKKIAPFNQYYYSNPRFIDEDRIVVGTRTPDSKMSLQILDLNTNTWEQLTPPSYNTLGLPFVAANTIYFTAGIDANDDLYALRLKDKKLFQLTADKTGNYYASVFQDSLVWAHFTAEGLQLRKEALSSLKWNNINGWNVQERPTLYPVALAKNSLVSSSRRFAEKRYSSATRLLNFHSYAPGYSDPEFTFNVYSDNILNTFSTTIFYRYNQSERSHGLGWNAAYGGFFPVLKSGAEYTFNRHIPLSTGEITLDQFEVKMGYSIPLNFTKGKTYKFLSFGSDYVLNKTIPTGASKNIFKQGIVSYLSHSIFWSQQLPAAVQHIYPKFGYALSANHRHLLSKSGYQFSGLTQIYLPSVTNHSIVLRAAVQQTDTANVIFSNRFSISRGYLAYYYSRMWKVAGNYHFPIAYPDFGFANIVYLQRLRGNLFYDLTRIYSKDKSRTKDLRSTGAELYFDTKWWNQLPVTIGVRYSYLIDNDFAGYRNRFEIIVPVNLIPN